MREYESHIKSVQNVHSLSIHKNTQHAGLCLCLLEDYQIIEG